MKVVACVAGMCGWHVECNAEIQTPHIPIEHKIVEDIL